MDINSKIAQLAVAKLFERHTVIPNVYLGGFELDLAIISKDWYLTEVEIKISRSDWMRDKDKKKWVVEAQSKTNYYRKRHKVTKFFYAVPEKLLDNIPDFVTPETGIISIRNIGKGIKGPFVARIVRQSTRLKKSRLNAKEINGLMRAMSFKVWKKIFSQDGAIRVCSHEFNPDFHS